MYSAYLRPLHLDLSFSISIFLPLCTVSFSFSRDFLCLGVFVCLLKSIYSFFFFLSFHFNPISFDCFFFFLCFFFGGTVVANYSNSFLSFWYLECVHIVRKRFADGLVSKGPTHYSIFSIQQMVTKSHFVCSFGNSCVFVSPIEILLVSISNFGCK